MGYHSNPWCTSEEDIERLIMKNPKPIDIQWSSFMISQYELLNGFKSKSPILKKPSPMTHQHTMAVDPMVVSSRAIVLAQRGSVCNTPTNVRPHAIPKQTCHQ